ncbi:hypothetical protein HG535_0C00710 [Zygotorulaspora mrakii]|uniref:Uncharacterized protein n=1 Tax=Zygotorulaspora mrakii TaxID=42260 RepID=A0A7H9B1S8_ZYGMR|nr:uncharacterized protein HG535_0C00710 [Zygotorulaspora mrakii]QLG71722.1 hypothetical protein HG535_0C00710 [Zygotorulaspora mrakii]
MRRLFSQVASRLLKKNENHDLQATLKFLTRGSVPGTSISSLLGGSSARSTVFEDEAGKEEDAKHVERILKILNSTLPEVESKKKRVEAHYDILFTQLKNIVEKSIENSAQTNGSRDVTVTSEVLYNKLMMLQYTSKLKVKEMAKLMLSKGFSQFDRVWENASMFNDMQKLDLSILLYYRKRDKSIRNEYESKWFKNYNRLHIIVQRILWRSVMNEKDTKEAAIQHIEHYIKQIPMWTSNDIVVLYQSLYGIAHLLPIESLNHGLQLSKNQELFLTTLRVLSGHGGELKDINKWLVKIVKLSVENKLAAEREPVQLKATTHSPTISIYQYKFIRGLDLALQEIHSSCDGNKYLTPLQEELETILRKANDEEQEIKSQMSLKFI